MMFFPLAFAILLGRKVVHTCILQSVLGPIVDILVGIHVLNYSYNEDCVENDLQDNAIHGIAGLTSLQCNVTSVHEHIIP